MSKQNFAKIDIKNYGFWGGLPQYLFVRLILIGYYKLFFKLEVEGKENIPQRGNAIVAPSHSSHLDPPLVAAALRKPISYMAKKELFEVPGLSLAIRSLRAFAVNRDKLEVATIKSSKNILKHTEWLLGIFPQGGRGEQGKIEKIKPGFGYLAKAASVPVIPVGIILKRGKYPWFGKAVVKVGNPIKPEGTPEEICEKWVKAICDLTGFEYDCSSCEEDSEKSAIC